MKFEILLSTMNQASQEIVEKVRVKSNVVVVNQCQHDSIKTVTQGNQTIKWIDVNDRGLSKSRNLLLKNASGDICMIADDDLEYVDNYESLILNEFVKYPEVDLIAFQVEGIEGKFKDYFPDVRMLNFVTSMKVSSVEIAFRLDSIRSKGIFFNERFGSGSIYNSGEENIFLKDCLKSGLKILYVPIKIADLHMLDSSWFRGYDRHFFISKGALFTELSRFWSILYIFQFAIRKKNLYSNEMNFVNALNFMMFGRKNYLDSLKKGG